jgi:hypothetical protein
VERNVRKYSEFVHATIVEPVNLGRCESPEPVGRRRVCGGATTRGDGEVTDSRDTEGSKVRRPAEFGETIFTEKPRQSIQDRLIADAITAHGYSQMDVASFLGLHYSTISRILTVKRRKYKDLSDPSDLVLVSFLAWVKSKNLK